MIFQELDTGFAEVKKKKKIEKKTPQAHLLEVGGGSKINSAVTVCSVDRGEHIVLELVSNTHRDLLSAWTDPAGWGCIGLPWGFLPVVDISIAQHSPDLVGDEHSDGKMDFVHICDCF